MACGKVKRGSKNKQVYSKQIIHSNGLLQERIHRKETAVAVRSQ